MQEIIAQALTYLWGIWRHKWLALAIAWVVALAGWAYVWQMPESYVASVKLYVDTNSVLRPLMRGLAITPDINQRIRSTYDGQLSLSTDYMVWNVTKDNIRVRMAAVEEAVWPPQPSEKPLVPDPSLKVPFSTFIVEGKYDMKDVITRIVDDGDFMEVHADYAQNILVGFARLGGRTIGIVAIIMASASRKQPSSM